MPANRNPFRPRPTFEPGKTNPFQPSVRQNPDAAITSQIPAKNFQLDTFVREMINLPFNIPSSKNAIMSRFQAGVEVLRLNGQTQLATKWSEKLSALASVVSSATALEKARNDLLREMYLSKMLTITVRKEYELWFESQQTAIEFQRRQRELDNAQFDLHTDAARKLHELNAEKHQTLLEKERLQRNLDQAEYDAKIAEARKKERRSKED